VGPAEKKGEMMDDLILTIETWLGDRTWRRLGEADYITGDGRAVKLAEWEGMCTICERPFRLMTPLGVCSAGQSKSFNTATCQAHRLTPSESAKIRFAKKGMRAEVFETIKRKKLAAE
jgi:hypothetical protein